MFVFPTFRERPELLDRWLEEHDPWAGMEWMYHDPMVSSLTRGLEHTSGSGEGCARICHTSNVYKGTVAQWTDWTQLEFIESGDYLAPGMMNPFQVSLETDEGTYREPNVWMIHDV